MPRGCNAEFATSSDCRIAAKSAVSGPQFGSPLVQAEHADCGGAWRHAHPQSVAGAVQSFAIITTRIGITLSTPSVDSSCGASLVASPSRGAVD
jgi:hypothetical protein